MAKKEEKTPLKKGTAQFMLIGEAKIGDFTFKIDETSKKSDWVWNQLNLGVDCGNGNVIYSEMMGGYGSERDNVIYVHGMKEDDKKKKQDDWENQFTIDWDDRMDETVLESIGDGCFIKVGLEKTVGKDKKESTYVQKFLSAYDAIAYIKEHLEEGMVVNVKGDLKYSTYEGNVQVKKEIKSIFLSKAEDSSKYKAAFTQTICLDKDSLGKLDKDKAVYPIYGRVIDYVKTYNEKEVKQNIGFAKTFELEVDKVNPEKTKLFTDKLIKAKKDINEITFEGEFVEGQSTKAITEADLPDDIKELIEMGAYTMEDAIGKLTISGAKEKRMIIKRPLIKMVGEEDNKKPVVVRTDAKYKEEDFMFDFMLEEEKEESDDADVDALLAGDDTDDTSWMDALNEDED